MSPFTGFLSITATSLILICTIIYYVRERQKDKDRLKVDELVIKKLNEERMRDEKINREFADHRKRLSDWMR